MNIDWEQPFQNIEIGKAQQFKKGSQVAVLVTGTLLHTALATAKAYEAVGVYYFGFVKPLDVQMLLEIFAKYEHIITVEEGVEHGGFGSAITCLAAKENYTGTIEIMGVPDQFVEHGNVEELLQIVRLDENSIHTRLQEILK